MTNKIGICVSHVNPDNIAFVGPYDSEQEAREALDGLIVSDGFEHCEAEDDQPESWQTESRGGAEGVMLEIEEAESFDLPPSMLKNAIDCSY